MAHLFKRTLLSSALCLYGATTYSHPSSTTPHQLLEKNAATTQLSVRSKTYQNQEDKVFVDGFGREISLRGFNVSGKVKHAEFGFQPFANTSDAKTSFNKLVNNTGVNMVRYTVAWEGIHTAPETIDYGYLDNAIAYMKEAIHNGLYVLVDYHSDLFSRHTFTSESKDTGNGAPE
ncbi:cellulase family glycosylhydrolase [Endozoicomonas ascidiicola]|uniref:cellulase family glycosylhydrolase n=1 Tax=Endozoicomonas ascidiicola TaxID=1698521 RepID=UPI000836E625|nr:cellulase family glycosylhydrolase [Endozoicomonas ascidiicola]